MKARIHDAKLNQNIINFEAAINSPEASSSSCNLSFATAPEPNCAWRLSTSWATIRRSPKCLASSSPSCSLKSDFIFSPSGLTFYGGLICAALAIWWYARKHKISFWHLNDAGSPALMLAYSTGRIGCQVSGDGDWGIVNNRPNPFSWLPDWMWGYTYPNNVARMDQDNPIPGCTDKFCFQLAEPHFPTPFYETVICFILFLILWSVRKKLKIPGTLFALYLILNGVERFFIEKIRVNTKMHVLGFQFTQAELISSLLLISGIVLWFYLRKRNAPVTSWFFKTVVE